MKAIKHSRVYISVALTGALFIIVLILCAPIMDSDDNFYILYTLAGGYGNEPTHLLHYYYEWHPLLFWPIARLFSCYPYFNWYTAFLLLLQWISCINIAYLFFLLFEKPLAIFLFIVFFLFFESAFLLSLNHSNTSFILAISGCSSLIYYFLPINIASKVNWKMLLFPAFLILAGGLLRVHTTVLYLVLCLGMGLIILPLYQYKKMAGVVILVGIVLTLFVLGHLYFYERKIPHSKMEERFRQSLFYLANHPVAYYGQDTGINRVKSSFIQSSFLYDTSFVTHKDIEDYTNKNISNRMSHNKEIPQILYWTIINARAYLLLPVLIFLFFLTCAAYRALGLWLLMSLPALLLYLYLAIFLKVTEGIFTTLLTSVFLSAVFCAPSIKFKKKPLSLLCPFLLILNLCWMVIRLNKINYLRTNKIQLTRAQLKEISTHSEFLFINTDKEFRDRAFYIWDTPLQYPLKNLIYKELIITNSYQRTLVRFGIQNLMQELPFRSDILLFNRIDPLLKEYYWARKGIKTEILAVPGFTFLTAHKVKISQNSDQH
jgi:hypothetical protein